jgi:hypothetical protein
MALDSAEGQWSIGFQPVSPNSDRKEEKSHGALGWGIKLSGEVKREAPAQTELALPEPLKGQGRLRLRSKARTPHLLRAKLFRAPTLQVPVFDHLSVLPLPEVFGRQRFR